MRLTLMVSYDPTGATTIALVRVWLAPVAFGGGGSPHVCHNTINNSIMQDTRVDGEGKTLKGAGR
jgi:hypothetical protein